MNFKELNLISPILRAIEEKNYHHPTSIQKKAIPIILKGKDIIGCAQTGTGKTAAFSIPIIQLIQTRDSSDKHRRKIRALIITPTRELALQINDNISQYAKYTNIRNTAIFGGVKQGAQVQNLKKGVHILVATPGRLLDLYRQGLVHIDDIKILVLDEADRMLDMGFIHDIKSILKIIPKKRQTLFFSATMPVSIIKLTKTILNNPIQVSADKISSAATTIQQYKYYTNRMLKPDLLLYILDENEIDQSLIFTRTKRGADRLVKKLSKNGIDARAIHGDKSQSQRQKALKMFKNGKLKLLVATDIAARGIDIDKLNYVFNFDIPDVPETYVHRIGRSGRAGNKGFAISICEPEEIVNIKQIEKHLKSQIREISDHPFPQTDKAMTAKERKELNKEKARKKSMFFANRKKKTQKRRR